eukprot:TRINITY_DN4334_c0_g1_i1.p1 TRINITY_DN4334_c0_g1~~TRINITY_DN4334_c0_g1_i1.p1  ORF type:complete len:269 (-),score=19.98 TRINITY_DN4334_c0_g1_i1:714-1520(-)
MSWRHPLLELSISSLVKNPNLCIPEHLAPLPPHIKDKIRRSLRCRHLSPDLLQALLHKNVTDLDLEDLEITDSHLEVVSKYKNYRKLNLNQTKKPSFKAIEKENETPPPCESSICQVLQGCRYLHTLFMAGWQSVTLEVMTTLVTSCPHIRFLDLGHCRPGLDDRMAAKVGELSRLESLSVTGSTAITDVGLSNIGASQAAATIKELRINKCREITDEGIEMLLMGLEALEILIFNGCPKVTDESRLALDRYLREHRVNVRQLSWTVY